MDAKARLTAIIGNTRHNAKVEEIVETLLAAGVTVPEPVKSGSVLTEDAKRALAGLHGYTGSCAASHVRLCPSCQATAKAVQDGLLTPAEVERRARAWWQGGRGGFSDLVAALTAPAATGTGVGK